MESPRPNNSESSLLTFDAWRQTRDTAGLILRLTRQPGLRDDPALAEALTQAALEAAGELARGRSLPAHRQDGKKGAYESALGWLAKLESVLGIAAAVGKLGAREGRETEEALSSARRCVHGLLRALNGGGRAPPPRASDAKFREGDPWGNRS